MKKFNPSLSPETANGICYPLYLDNFTLRSLCTKWLQAETIQKKTDGICWQGSWGNLVCDRGTTDSGLPELVDEVFFFLISTIFSWIIMPDFFNCLLWTHHYLLSWTLWSLYLWLANAHSLAVLLVSQTSSVAFSFSIKLKSTEQEYNWNQQKTRLIYYVQLKLRGILSHLEL